MEDFIAGAVGGAAGLLAGHPMEVMKVQLQLAPTGHATLATRAMFSKGVLQGLFQGMAVPMASFMAINSALFGVYGRTLSVLEERRPGSHNANVFWSGVAGGAAQFPITAPVELIKTAMQAQLSRTRTAAEMHRGPIAFARAIVRRDGAAGLTRGFAVTLVRDVPSFGLYMLIYDWLYRRLGHVTSQTAATVLAGGFAGSVSWFSVLPLDNVKSNLQADAGRGGPRRTGLSVARQVFSQHGIPGFYRGGLVMVLRSFPVNAVTFLAWSRTRQLLTSPSGVNGSD